MLNPTLKAQLGLNDDQISEFKVAFDIFDEDGSGTVSTGELASVMSTLGQKIDEAEVGVMISEVDSDGFIDNAELKHVMGNIGEDMDDSEISEMMKEADVDGDGKLNYDEFLNIMLAK